MEKEFNFGIDELMLLKISQPIRGPIDIIHLLLETLKYLLYQKPSENGNLKLTVEKMNRIFYVLDKKIFSISMPFFTKVMEDGSICVYDHFANLDSKILSTLINVFNKISEQVETSIGALDIWQLLDEEQLGQEDLDVINYLIVKLLLTEYGYVRYDDDEEHEKGKIHPRYHLDINCSNSCTYKLGLSKEIDYNWLRDCLNNDLPRKDIVD